MPIYEVTTRERSVRGGEFSSSYLFDSERLIAILDYKRENPYATSAGHKIADVNYLVTKPKQLPRNQEGWEILKSRARKLRMTQAEFDRLVERTPPHMPISFYLQEKKDLDRMVA